jgi:hypothetical protein
MKNEDIYKEWTKFIKDYEYYFLSEKELWYITLEQVKKYMDDNNKRPSSHDKDDHIKYLGSWFTSTQPQNYSKKDKIMENIEIYNEWTKFINDEKYKKYFLTNEDEWIIILNDVKKYIDTNNKRPTSQDKNIIYRKLGNWIIANTKKFKTKSMNNEEIYKKWTEFINDPIYKKYF